jgi:hypothetical protein
VAAGEIGRVWAGDNTPEWRAAEYGYLTAAQDHLKAYSHQFNREGITPR